MDSTLTTGKIFKSDSRGIPKKSYFVIGTAGHIDHGKTTLVRALTGQDTDRLPEEKKRGISIDLGFAYFRLPNGTRAAIVDVPGHERFIRNMIAGVSGIDACLLVIAANEGPMPQSKEHLDILQLLGVKRGLVALTKTDMVDSEELECVTKSVLEFLKGTFLEGSPVISVSSATGHGLDHLQNSLSTISEHLPLEQENGATCMPVDRAFIVPGFGPVVTGTVMNGRIKVGESFELLPQGIEVRVRSLEAHRVEVPEVDKGTRAALNLVGQGLNIHLIKRGMVLAEPGIFAPIRDFNAHLETLKDLKNPLKTGSRIRLHLGTTEVMARITLLENDKLGPGEGAYARIKTESDVIIVPRMRFIMRSYSPVTTIGGGAVIDTEKRYRRYDANSIAFLKKVHSASPQNLVMIEIERYCRPVSLLELAKKTGLSVRFVKCSVKNALERKEAILLYEATGQDGGTQEKVAVLNVENDVIVARSTAESFLAGIQKTLKRFYATSRFSKGMKIEDLRTVVAPDWDGRPFAALVGIMSRKGAVVLSGDIVSLPHSGPRLSEREAAAKKRMIEAFQAGAFAPPSISEVIQQTGMDQRLGKEIAALLEKDGVIVRIQGDMAFHTTWIREASDRLISYLKQNKTITVSQFRELLGTSRKYALPLLTHFDSQKLTRRVGDVRVLLRQT
jgi:selenocysteine-specific elongation factor